MNHVEWERREESAYCVHAGWRLIIDRRYVGTVWLDGSASACMLDFGLVDFGSQPLAAQALLRAAGVEP